MVTSRNEQQLGTGRIGGHQPERQPELTVSRKPDPRRSSFAFAIQVLDEIGHPHQVVDPQAVVRLALEIEPAARRAVEPEDLAVGAEQDRAVRHRRGHPPEFAQQRERAALVIDLAAVQSVDDGHDLAPQPLQVRRRAGGARAQPAIEAQQADAVPHQHRASVPATKASGRPAIRPTSSAAASRARLATMNCQAGFDTGFSRAGAPTPAASRSGNPSRVRSAPGRLDPTARAPCGACGYARPPCVLRRRRCRPIPGQATGCASTRARGAP